LAIWTTAAPVVTAAFLASLVEAVEALTIVLAVAMVRGPKPALLGTFASLALLACLVAILGTTLGLVPLALLQLVIGVLLLLFGLRWLRKAILRAAGIIALHDEQAAFLEQEAELRGEALQHERRLDWLAGLAAFKAVTLEGLEVVFIVIAVGAGRGLLGPASLGAAAACILVAAVGIAVRRPLARVPENVLKFLVGVMLSSFGLFWTGEGLGVPWPGEDLFIVALIVLFLAAALAMVQWLRRPRDHDGSGLNLPKIKNGTDSENAERDAAGKPTATFLQLASTKIADERYEDGSTRTRRTLCRRRLSRHLGRSGHRSRRFIGLWA
jgi:uncharacterized membrane protein